MTSIIVKTEILRSRKGASKATDIPDDVLAGLNRGILESVNLTEWLAVDHMQLLENVLSCYPDHLAACKAQVGKPEAMSVRTLIVQISNILSTRIGAEPGLFAYLANYPSDSVRCWAVYMVGLNNDLNLKEKFKAIYPFAADPHFGVRELAWMAMREDIERNLLESIGILVGWTSSADENIRRFVTEATRPRGVWCKQLKALITQPDIAINLLTPLKADPSAYVQLSLGNWLNDAGKSQPEWVLRLCKSWIDQDPNEHTLKIVKRGTRNLSFS
ncbi:DNA alkylation repair protein [Pedobacter gandavensis]|uniref:DNA alkylation repair protein n=1 Tax=Pedobacter gandavensis TaxID=2679963 RepID=A0ABR6EQJ7_9SPHI|nr:DNA alkylation repair protein [Pedobacter gandavensis]MBB2147516.1 DNA alkylation repair protein [Pedobacter gandavensis]